MTETKKRTPSQNGKYSKRKGAAFELWVAHYLKERGFDAKRGIQSTGLLQHDVQVNLPINFECKRVESLNLNVAYDQAKFDANNKGVVPMVVHKKNNKPVMISMGFGDFVDFLQYATNKVDGLNTLDLAEFWDNKDENLL